MVLIKSPRTDDFREQEAYRRQLNWNSSLALSQAYSVSIIASVVESKTSSVASLVSVTDSKADSVSTRASSVNSKTDSAGNAASVADSKGSQASNSASAASSSASGASTAASTADSKASNASLAASIAKSSAESGAFVTGFVAGVVTTIKVSTSQIDYSKRQIMYNGSSDITTWGSDANWWFTTITHNLGRRVVIELALTGTLINNSNTRSYGIKNNDVNSFVIQVANNWNTGTCYYDYW